MHRIHKEDLDWKGLWKLYNNRPTPQSLKFIKQLMSEKYTNNKDIGGLQFANVPLVEKVNGGEGKAVKTAPE